MLIVIRVALPRKAENDEYLIELLLKEIFVIRTKKKSEFGLVIIQIKGIPRNGLNQ